MYRTRREEYVRGDDSVRAAWASDGGEAIRACFYETYAAYNWLRAVEFVERGLAERKAVRFIAGTSRHRSASPGEGVERGSS